MQRKSEIIRYSKKDKGNVTIPRKDISAEIPTKVNDSGHAYAGREFVGQDVRILVMREDKANVGQFEQYLKGKISFWEKWEHEDLLENDQEAAYRAKIIKEAYEDTLTKLRELEE